MRIRVLIEPSVEPGLLLAYCPELPGCSVVASSRDAAMREVRRLIENLLTPESPWVPPGAECETLEL